MLIPGPGFESIHRIRSTYLKLFRRKLDSANSSLIDYTKFCATLNKVKILANHQCWTKPSLLFYFSLYSFWKQTKKKKSLIKLLIRQVFWVFSINLMQFKHFIIPVNIILHITILCINCHLQQIHESLDIIFCVQKFSKSALVLSELPVPSTTHSGSWLKCSFWHKLCHFRSKNTCQWLIVSQPC